MSQPVPYRDYHPQEERCILTIGSFAKCELCGGELDAYEDTWPIRQCRRCCAFVDSAGRPVQPEAE